MSRQTPSWGEFEKPRARIPTANPFSIEECWARLLMSPDGQQALAWMREQTIEKRNRAGATEAEIRELEAQRRFVAEIENLNERGLKAMSERKDS